MNKNFGFTADQLERVFSSQVGNVERPRNSNKTKYGVWYGANGVSYCGIGVNWCFSHVANGLDLRKIGFSPAWTPGFLDKGGKSPYFTRVSKYDIRPGDIVFFDFPDKVYRTQHVGLATSRISGGRFKTIEFNTSASASGSQDNGGGVYRKSRLVAHVSGVLRPHYAASKSPAKPAAPKPQRPAQRVTPPTLQRGSRGAWVKVLQRRLGLSPDGDFGPKTEGRVRHHQKNHKLTVDGVVGPATWKNLGY